ncbi:hypothetical protein T12_16827 [Trichinella patagoniensis]|uniref:Uncharacterized protein n=1 Tax=Trichinella patagoniensis TaxID=990121 RepID=A0A0V0YVR5_9BILA|nr:hypothetical protein T12_16827 [Trichinella patagoniensis]
MVTVAAYASRYYFVLLSRPATNGVNQRLNDQIRLDSRVNYYYSPLALRRYSFVANIWSSEPDREGQRPADNLWITCG